MHFPGVVSNGYPHKRPWNPRAGRMKRQPKRIQALLLRASQRAAKLALRPDPVEIDASYAGIPEIAAERTGADRRGEFHLSGLRVAAEERQPVCGCGDSFLADGRTIGAVIRTSRKQNGEQADQERQRRGQKQRAPAGSPRLPAVRGAAASERSSARTPTTSKMAQTAGGVCRMIRHSARTGSVKTSR